MAQASPIDLPTSEPHFLILEAVFPTQSLTELMIPLTNFLNLALCLYNSVNAVPIATIAVIAIPNGLVKKKVPILLNIPRTFFPIGNTFFNPDTNLLPKVIAKSLILPVSGAILSFKVPKSDFKPPNLSFALPALSCNFNNDPATSINGFLNALEAAFIAIIPVAITPKAFG